MFFHQAYKVLPRNWWYFVLLWQFFAALLYEHWIIKRIEWTASQIKNLLFILLLFVSEVTHWPIVPLCVTPPGMFRQGNRPYWCRGWGVVTGTADHTISCLLTVVWRCWESRLGQIWDAGVQKAVNYSSDNFIRTHLLELLNIYPAR